MGIKLKYKMGHPSLIPVYLPTHYILLMGSTISKSLAAVKLVIENDHALSSIANHINS